MKQKAKLICDICGSALVEYEGGIFNRKINLIAYHTVKKTNNHEFYKNDYHFCGNCFAHVMNIAEYMVKADLDASSKYSCILDMKAVIRKYKKHEGNEQQEDENGRGER